MTWPLTTNKLSTVTPEPILNATDNPGVIPSTAGMTAKVVKGGIWTLVGQVLPLLASLIATPFVIRLLGAEQYGVLALVNVFVSYMAFADFGMGMASTNFASEAYAKGSADNEAKAVRLAALIGLSTTTTTAIIVVFLARYIVIDLLKIPNHLQDIATAAIYLSCVTFAARVMSGILNSPQLVRLRMDLNSSINGIFNIVQIVAVPIVIYFGGGIVGAVITVMCSAVAALVVHTVVSGRLLKPLFQFGLDRSSVKPLLRFGSSIFIALIAGVLLANLEKVVLTRYTSVTVFAYYSVAFTLANMVTLFSGSMAQSLVPAFSQLFTSQKHSQMQELYARTIRLNLVVFAPIALVLSIVAKPFFNIWAGEDFGRESTGPFYVLLIGLFFNFSVAVAGAIIIAARRSSVTAFLYWAELVPYGVLVGFLTYRWGAVGAATAWSLRLMFQAIIHVFLVKSFIGLSFDFADKKLSVVALGILLLLISPVLNFFLPQYFGMSLIFACFCLACYCLLIWRYGISSDERMFASSLFSSIRIFPRT